MAVSVPRLLRPRRKPLVRKTEAMFPMTPTIFLVIDILAALVIALLGVSVLMYLFATTLVVTTGVAINRSIPRKEK